VNRATRRWRIVFLLGLLATTLGVGLVVQGEIQRARDDERFRNVQEALKAGIEVFSDNDTLSDDLTQDPNIGQRASGATSLEPASGTVPKGGTPLRAIGRLQIPAINLDVAMLRYGRYADLEIGLAWMPQSAALGTEGASIIIGHRTLFGAPLRDADELKKGDPIYLQLPDGSNLTYQVQTTLIRRPTESFNDLLSGGTGSRLVIVTCHPEYSTDFRLLVVADVVEKV
jgi:LPXTG-site transpeptidase (sortase) family protein